MHIKIAQRWRPYSHALGSRCLIPGTTVCGEIFPTLMRLYDLSSSQPSLIAEVSFDLSAPVRQFTIRQDLEKGYVDVWGDSQKGFFHYRLQAATNGGVDFLVKKCPLGSTMPATAFFGLEGTTVALPASFENLFFGISKAQEWPLIHRRLSLGEIMPIWFRLGQWIPPFDAHAQIAGGTVALLPGLEKCIAERNLAALPFEFERLYLAGFEGMLSPRSEDSEHQGFALPPLAREAVSPLILLREGARLIRKTFVDIVDKEVLILPALMPQLHCGRMLNLALGDFGCLHLEWSKKVIRRMLFTPRADCSLGFRFYKGIHTCRMRAGETDVARYRCGEAFDFLAEKSYVFDNFQ